MFLKIITTLALIVAAVAGVSTQETNTASEKNQTRSQRAAVVGASYTSGYAPDGGYSYEKPAIGFGTNQNNLNLGVTYSAVGYTGPTTGGVNTYNVGVGYTGPKGVNSIGYNGFGVAAKGTAGFGGGIGVNSLNVGYNGVKGGLNTYGSGVNSYNVGIGNNAVKGGSFNYATSYTGANSINLGIGATATKNIGYNGITGATGLAYNRPQTTFTGVNSYGGQYNAGTGFSNNYAGFNGLNCHQHGYATQYSGPQYQSYSTQYNIPKQQNYFGQVQTNYVGQQPGFVSQYNVGRQSNYNQFNVQKQPVFTGQYGVPKQQSFTNQYNANFSGQYGAPKQQGYVGQYEVGKQNYYTQFGGPKQQNYFSQYDNTKQNVNGIFNTIKPHREYGVPDAYKYATKNGYVY